VFFTALSEDADRRFVGTVLSAQTAVGSAPPVLSIRLVPPLAVLPDRLLTRVSGGWHPIAVWGR
jgi:hypothetical protein